MIPKVNNTVEVNVNFTQDIFSDSSEIEHISMQITEASDDCENYKYALDNYLVYIIGNTCDASHLSASTKPQGHITYRSTSAIDIESSMLTSASITYVIYDGVNYKHKKIMHIDGDDLREIFNNKDFSSQNWFS